MQKLSKKMSNLAKKLNVGLEYSFGTEKVGSIKFKFAKSVWADLANTNGEFLPICCANVSAIRDCCISAMREDGEMSAEDLQTVYINMAGHEYDEGNPINHMGKVYEALEGNLDLRKPMSSKGDLEDVMSRASFGKIFKFCSNYDFRNTISKMDTIHQQASHNLALYQIMPIVKKLNDELASTKFNPVEGYALVRKATNEIYEFANTELAILTTEDEAIKVMESWIESNQLKSDDIEVKMVRISMENGIEYVEKINNPFTFEKKPAEIDKEQADVLWNSINTLRHDNNFKWKNDKIEAILLNALNQVRELKNGH